MSGPAGYLHPVPGTEILGGLAPGTYAIDASSIMRGDTTYLPAPAHQTAALVAGDATPVIVTYAPSDRATTLNLWVDGLYLTQATQRYDGTVPLVAGRDAYLRVFIRANQANGERPDVRVRLWNGPALVQTWLIPATSPFVPSEVDEGALVRSWNASVPGALVQPGLRVLADLDPASVIAEVDRADNQFPASGAPRTVDVHALPAWRARFVPILAHEEGHNLGRPHAPCGGAGSPDPSFPYPGGLIGVWGLDLRSWSPKSPAATPDLMGYCSGNWISDFDWSAMIGYRESGPNLTVGNESGAGTGLLIWGRITEDRIWLEPAFRVTAFRGTAPAPGPFRLELRGGEGSLLESVGFGADEVADLPRRGRAPLRVHRPSRLAAGAAPHRHHRPCGGAERHALRLRFRG